VAARQQRHHLQELDASYGSISSVPEDGRAAGFMVIGITVPPDINFFTML
jgi:hypothetical protein